MFNFLKKLINILFPTQCIICNDYGADLCNKCLASFEQSKISNYDWLFSLWDYRDSNVEKLMRYIKNNPNKRIANILAIKLRIMILHEIKNGKPEITKLKDTIIIPIPIHKTRFRERGYNQSELIAKPFAKLLNRNLCTNVLYKNKQTKKQGTSKSRSERSKNITGSFSVKNIHLINNRDVLLIDDITTTGSTILEARKVLITSGARNVVAITIAN